MRFRSMTFKVGFQITDMNLEISEYRKYIIDDA